MGRDLEGRLTPQLRMCYLHTGANVSQVSEPREYVCDSRTLEEERGVTGFCQMMVPVCFVSILTEIRTLKLNCTVVRGKRLCHTSFVGVELL